MNRRTEGGAFMYMFSRIVYVFSVNTACLETFNVWTMQDKIESQINTCTTRKCACLQLGSGDTWRWLAVLIFFFWRHPRTGADCKTWWHNTLHQHVITNKTKQALVYCTVLTPFTGLLHIDPHYMSRRMWAEHKRGGGAYTSTLARSFWTSPQRAISCLLSSYSCSANSELKTQTTSCAQTSCMVTFTALKITANASACQQNVSKGEQKTTRTYMYHSCMNRS